MILPRWGQTQCRVAGKHTWQTVDEHLPLLKYVHRAASPTVPKVASIIPVSVQVATNPPVADEPFRTDERGKPSLTSSLKAGWICFGLGVAIAWIFPPAFLFYSVALIMAIVAMCTHQVSRGLILLLSSFVAMGTSALLSMILAVGLFAAAMKPALADVQKANEQMRRAERDMEAQMQGFRANTNRALQRALAPTPRPALPSFQPASPVVGYPPESLSQRDLMDEIARVEAKQRQLRRMGRDLDSLTQDYLSKLRAKLDSHSGR